MPSSLGISLHITITIAPSNLDKFFAAFRPVFDRVTAEPQCTFFEVYQSPEDPGVLSWVENWDESLKWFMGVQVQKEYYKEYFEVTEPMFLAPRQVKVLKRVGAPYVVFKGEVDGNGGE